MEIERMKKMGIALLCADDKYELAEQIADKVCLWKKGKSNGRVQLKIW